MKRRLRALLFLVAGCASLNATPDAYFVDLEHRWLDALQKHDVAALDALLDDSFVDVTFRGGVRTKHDVMTGPPMSGPYHSIRLDDLAVRRYGSAVAVVTGVNVLQGATADDLARIRFTDVFAKRDGRWRAVSAQETLESSR